MNAKERWTELDERMDAVVDAVKEAAASIRTVKTHANDKDVDWDDMMDANAIASKACWFAAKEMGRAALDVAAIEMAIQDDLPFDETRVLIEEIWADVEW